MGPGDTILQTALSRLFCSYRAPSPLAGRLMINLDVGMLWYDDSHGLSLSDKIARAAAHYRTKYGRAPNICYVPAQALAQGAPSLDGLAVKELASLLPHHFWLGVAQAQV